MLEIVPHPEQQLFVPRIATTNGTHWCMPTTLIAAHTTNTNGGNCDELSQQGATQVVSWLPRGYERVAPRACTSSPTGHPEGPERSPLLG